MNRTRLANEAWEALFRAQATLDHEFAAAGYWEGCPPREYGVLYALSTAGDGLRVTELIGDALLTQAGVSRLVDRLEQRGLVERHPDPDDARASRVVLTAAGRETQRRLGRAHARHVAEAMTRALTPEQLVTLRELARAVTGAAERAAERKG